MGRRRIRVGLIGAGIGQSKSPMLHMTEGAAQGFDLDYRLFDLDHLGGRGSLSAVLDRVEAEGYAGVNVTHPCKQAVIPLLAGLSADAAALGAVNTVVFGPAGRQGHNTDWSGFLEGFRRGLPGVPLGTVLQLGAGGAGAAVAHAVCKLGAGRLWLTDADAARAADLAEALNARAGRDFAAATGDLAAAMAAADGLINATPMGMAAHPGLPLEGELLTPRHWVAEIVYFPLETALLRLARERGCRTVDGGGMAVFQAVEAFRLFTGTPPDAERMLCRFRDTIAR